MHQIVSGPMLGKRGVVCVRHVETVDHSFVLCEVAYSIWYCVFQWLGLPGALPCSNLGFLSCFKVLGMGDGHIFAFFRYGILWSE